VLIIGGISKRLKKLVSSKREKDCRTSKGKREKKKGSFKTLGATGKKFRMAREQNKKVPTNGRRRQES